MAVVYDAESPYWDQVLLNNTNTQILLWCRLLLGELSAFSASWATDYNLAFYILLSTHHSWVNRGSIECEVYSTILPSSGSLTPEVSF